MSLSILPLPEGSGGGGGQITVPQRVVAVSDTIAVTDRVILCDHAAPITLDLPAAATTESLFIIKDKAGAASSFAITIAAPLGSDIDGFPAYSLNVGLRSVWIGRGADGSFFVI